jgi:hypothetical protein
MALGDLVDLNKDPREVPTKDRRAEILCPKKHLVGVVTNDEVRLLTGEPMPLTASHSRLVLCLRCGYHSPEYELDIPVLFNYVREHAEWRVRVPIGAISKKRPFH